MVAASCAAVGLATPVSFFPPNATSAVAAPKPLKGILALSNFASVTAASVIVVAFPTLVIGPVKLALVVTVAAFPVIEPAIVELKVCVPVKVWSASVLAIVASVDGKVIVFPSVPANTIELLAVKVLPSAIVKVALFAGSVIVSLFIEVAEAAPNTGAVIVGLVKVLFVKVSVPSSVAKVPVVGKVTVVAAVAVNVVAKAPEVVKFPPKVIVFPELSTPVPPLAPSKIPVTPVVKGNPVALVNTAAEGVPKFGVTKVGEVALTTSPEPVVVISSTTPALAETRPKTLSAATF